MHSQRRKVATLKFQKKFRPAGRDISSFILTHFQEISQIIAEHIISVRMTSYHTYLNTLQDIHRYFFDEFSKKIIEIGKKLELTEKEINKLINLTEKIVLPLISNRDLNMQWASRYLVNLYRASTMKWKVWNQINFYTSNTPFQQIISLNSRVFYTTKHHQHQVKTRASFSRLKENVFLSYAEIDDHIFEMQRKKFFQHMPKSCETLNSTHTIVQCYILAFCIFGILLFIGNQLNLDVFSIFNVSILGVSSLFISFFMRLGTTIAGNYCGVDVGWQRNPFALNKMNIELKEGLFSEIKDAFGQVLDLKTADTSVNEVKDQKTKRSSHPGEIKNRLEKKSSAELVSTSQSVAWSLTYDYPTKKKHVKKLKDAKIIPVSNHQTIFEMIKLPPLLVWVTKLYGVIRVRIGQTMPNIFTVWSLIPALDAVYNSYYLYCPTEFLARQDAGMIEEFLQTLRIGRIVAPDAHAGIVREKTDVKECLKVKLFSRAQGTSAQGAPSQHRLLFFQATYPEDLEQMPPQIEGRTYQLFLPKMLVQTHR